MQTPFRPQDLGAPVHIRVYRSRCCKSPEPSHKHFRWPPGCTDRRIEREVTCYVGSTELARGWLVVSVAAHRKVKWSLVCHQTLICSTKLSRTIRWYALFCEWSEITCQSCAQAEYSAQCTQGVSTVSELTGKVVRIRKLLSRIIDEARTFLVVLFHTLWVDRLTYRAKRMLIACPLQVHLYNSLSQSSQLR